MKKFTLVALAMMASASCFAQTYLWNGEDKNIGDKHSANGFWDRCDPEVVENPLKDGINTSDKCVKFTITGNDANNGGIVLPLSGGLDMTSKKRLSIMIKKPLWSNVQIELSAGEGTYWRRIAANYADGGKAGQWQKLVFDFTDYGDDLNKKFPTELAIYPMFEPEQTGSQEIFVDDIVLEDNPTVNEKSLWNEKEGSLEGNLTLTGGYFKTNYFIVEPWTEKNIDDFVKLNEKLSAEVTSIDMRKASTLGVDINQFFFKNPNTIVYANENYDHANVVVNGTAKTLDLTDAHAFNAPYDFTAESVKLTRGVQAGFNSFVLPFEVTANELAADKVATYADCDKDGDKKANFNTVPKVAANTPFLTKDAADNTKTGVLEFGEKDIVATPDNLGEHFVGVYKRTNAQGFYGINGDGKLQKGGEKAYVNPFHAYLNVDKQLDAVAFDGSTVTAINGIAADKVANTAVYDLSGRRVNGKLQKGLYIMNGKKVVVK